jgi:hypothetical protein
VSPSASEDVSWRRRLLYLLVVEVRIEEKKDDVDEGPCCCWSY